ncbi:hypothetical protein, partial [Streptomyces sp. PTD5-9]|uniref:hypothetical protein n=1 Tax=Streptomyces sp. PTD5-9 TaxID=3120150 RepID=UPI003009CFAC
LDLAQDFLVQSKLKLLERSYEVLRNLKSGCTKLSVSPSSRVRLLGARASACGDMGDDWRAGNLESRELRRHSALLGL